MDSFITIVTTLTDQLQKPTLAFLLGGMMLAALGSRFEIPQPVYKFIVILLLLKVGLSGIEVDGQAIARGLLFAPICMAGVIAGQKLFQPRLEPYYKPFCLCLLMLLAAAGLARMGLA